jgi:rhamnulose-1-phosphate aldolase/alcohol dehydrogenase
MIAHFTDDDRVLEFVNSKDFEKLAFLGTSCPDHFLRTKIRPMILDLKSDTNFTDPDKLKVLFEPSFETYRSHYAEYYEKHKRSGSPAIRDPNPVVILLPGIGMFTFAKNKQTARVASEFYINAINVMRGAEAVSEYVSLPLQEAFDIEYWLLEEAKLQRMPKEKSLSRKVAFIAGGTGGIGKAIAELFLNEGACVIITDMDEDPPEDVIKLCQSDNAIYAKMDVTNPEEVSEAFRKTTLEFGGVDIIVNSAGLAISKPLAETSDTDYDLLMDVLVKGQFQVSKAGANLMQAQGMGGDIVNIVSKNALVAGPNNVVYGTAKASQAHMTRLLASELGAHKIRVNMVNPDAVIEGSKIWKGKWAEGRAKAYGISVDELPGHYASRTLLNEIITTEDIANGVFALVSGRLGKSTGNTINIDGGIAAAFVR